MHVSLSVSALGGAHKLTCLDFHPDQLWLCDYDTVPLSDVHDRVCAEFLLFYLLYRSYRKVLPRFYFWQDNMEVVDKVSLREPSEVLQKFWSSEFTLEKLVLQTMGLGIGRYHQAQNFIPEMSDHTLRDSVWVCVTCVLAPMHPLIHPGGNRSAASQSQMTHSCFNSAMGDPPTYVLFFLHFSCLLSLACVITLPWHFYDRKMKEFTEQLVQKHRHFWIYKWKHSFCCSAGLLAYVNNFTR